MTFHRTAPPSATSPAAPALCEVRGQTGVPRVAPLRWSYRGLVPYADALKRQHALRDEVAGGAPDYLLLLEHPPTITLGRRGKPEDIVWPPEELAREGIAIVATDRGG